MNLVPIKAQDDQSPIDALLANVSTPKTPCMLLCFLGEQKNKTNYGLVKEFCNKQGIISQCVNISYVGSFFYFTIFLFTSFSKQTAKAEQKFTIVGNIMVSLLFFYLTWRQYNLLLIY